MALKHACISGLIVFLSGLCFAQMNSEIAGQLRQHATEINATSRYCQTVDHLLRSSKPLTFFSSGRGWTNDTTGADSIASVWAKDGKVVAVKISSQAATKSGIEATQYCFREDGSLAQVLVLPSVRSSGKAAVDRKMTVGRGAMYSAGGEKILTIQPHFDPNSLKSERTTITYLDPPAIYKSPSDLPFINLIRQKL